MKTNDTCRSASLLLGTRPSFGTHGQWLLWVCVSIWLAGCATSSDPHEGGFVSGVVGLAGGGYQQRIDAREGVHQDELNAQQRLKAQSRALEQERAQVRSDLARAQARLANQERRIAKERARLAAEHNNSAETQAGLRRLDQAQAQLVSAKGALRSVRTNEEAVADLQSRSRDIEKELDEIDSMVNVVAANRF
jgi:outer membrane murein-binding lipoprotein Lpp